MQGSISLDELHVRGAGDGGLEPYVWPLFFATDAIFDAHVAIQILAMAPGARDLAAVARLAQAVGLGAAVRPVVEGTEPPDDGDVARASAIVVDLARRIGVEVDLEDASLRTPRGIDHRRRARILLAMSNLQLRGWSIASRGGKHVIAARARRGASLPIAPELGLARFPDRIDPITGAGKLGVALILLERDLPSIDREPFELYAEFVQGVRAQVIADAARDTLRAWHGAGGAPADAVRDAAFFTAVCGRLNDRPDAVRGAAIRRWDVTTVCVDRAWSISMRGGAFIVDGRVSPGMLEPLAPPRRLGAATTR